VDGDVVELGDVHGEGFRVRGSGFSGGESSGQRAEDDGIQCRGLVGVGQRCWACGLFDAGYAVGSDRWPVEVFS
jgi:hypothetical protein